MGTTFSYCIPVSFWSVHIKSKEWKKMRVQKMPLNFNELPKKALKTIFGNLSQTERVRDREVCRLWNNFILEEFPVELVITQGNYERMFRCPNARAAEIQGLTSEYTGPIAFGRTIRSMHFTGKVLSSNVFSILGHCTDLETLRFSSLKQVLGIEEVESLKLPKLHTVEFVVRSDQETFTADEIIIINILRKVILNSLKTVLVTTKNTFEEYWEDEEDSESMNDESSDSKTNDGGGTGHSRSFSITSLDTLRSSMTNNPPITPPTGEIVGPVPGVEVRAISNENPNVLVVEPVSNANTNTAGPITAGTQTMNTNLQVIINRAANFGDPTNSIATAPTVSSSGVSAASSTRRVRYNISEFEARLFYANLELLMASTPAESNVHHLLNDSRSRTRIDSGTLLNMPGVTIPALKPTVFFEFLKHNHASVKNLLVRARTDFTCFGNLTAFSKDLTNLQFEDVEYSFGRMEMCQEHHLLREQRNLVKLKVQVLDDMWKHLMFAIQHCRSTLEEIDVKVLSVGDDNFDMTAILGCSNLKSLKLLHFFEKGPLSNLPKSLNKLVLNGPVTYDDMTSWTTNLQELTDLTLLLNVRGDTIDLKLYKKFLKMRKMRRLTFIQCPMALDEIERYYNTTLKSLKGIRFWFSGPKEIRDIPSIQYVYTLINPDEFDNEQIRIEE